MGPTVREEDDVSARVFINVTPAKAFEAISDLARHPEWASHTITVEAAEAGPPRVGSHYTAVYRRGNPPHLLTVTELVPNERIVYHSATPQNIEIDFTMTVEPWGDGALVFRESSLTKTPLAMMPLKALFPVFRPKLEQKFLNRLKEKLEAA